MATIGSVLVAAVLVGGLAGCASDDESGSQPTPADASSSGNAESGSGSDATDDGESVPSGAGTGTLTMADGTIYTLEMSTCDTSENDDGYVVEDGYDLSGKTADGEFKVSFIRAGLDESSIVEIGTLEGEFDENGKNNQLTYKDVVDTMALTVDGGNVSGTLTMKPIGPNNPHGDESEATVDISC